MSGPFCYTLKLRSQYPVFSNLFGVVLTVSKNQIFFSPFLCKNGAVWTGPKYFLHTLCGSSSIQGSTFWKSAAPNWGRLLFEKIRNAWYSKITIAVQSDDITETILKIFQNVLCQSGGCLNRFQWSISTVSSRTCRPHNSKIFMLPHLPSSGFSSRNKSALATMWTGIEVSKIEHSYINRCVYQGSSNRGARGPWPRNFPAEKRKSFGKKAIPPLIECYNLLCCILCSTNN